MIFKHPFYRVWVVHVHVYTKFLLMRSFKFEVGSFGTYYWLDILVQGQQRGVCVAVLYRLHGADITVHTYVCMYVYMYVHMIDYSIFHTCMLKAIFT